MTQDKIKNEIAILYNLARTGGTLIAKCIGCIENNVVLSEIHPAISVKNPIQQAMEWFGLVDHNDFKHVIDNNQVKYVDAIKIIAKKAKEKNQKLIIRDWSHIDFTAVPFANRRSNKLRQAEVLKNDFNIRQFSTVRHPLDTILSLSKLRIMQNKLNLRDYLAGSKEFAKKAAEMGFVRYEEFCSNPQKYLKLITNSLDVTYSEKFLTNFYKYPYITGDIGNSGIKTIKRKRPTNYPCDLKKAIEKISDYWEILEILGYENSFDQEFH